MGYVNPVPKVDSFKEFKIITTFTFKEEIEKEDAIQGITNVLINAINENGGVLPVSWIGGRNESNQNNNR